MAVFPNRDFFRSLLVLRRSPFSPRNMGAATARIFARDGAKVVIADVLEHEGRQVADAIGASARFEPLDVTKEELGRRRDRHHPSFR